MFDFTHDTHQDRPTALDDLRMFAEGHGDALVNAAALLGGAPGVRLARTALTGLADTPSRSTMRALDELLELLLLEHAHDPGRIESGRFAAIDPADPCVEEICLLADGLDEALRAYSVWAAGHVAPIGFEVAA